MGFREWLSDPELALQPSTVELYLLCAARAEREYEVLEKVLEDEKLSLSRRETYRRALLHYARFSADEKLVERLRVWRPSRRERKVKRVKGPAVALELKTEWRALRQEILRYNRSSVARAVFYLLATTGLRLSEVLDLTAKDLKTLKESHRTEILQKGQKPRLVILVTERQSQAVGYLSSVVRKSVLHSLTTRRRRSKKAVEGFLRSELELLAKRVGITKHVTPHVLRRTVGDAVYEKTKDIRLVQEILGHSSARTTRSWYQDHNHPQEAADGLGLALSEGDEE